MLYRSWTAEQPAVLCKLCAEAFTAPGLQPKYARVECGLTHIFWQPGNDLLLLRPKARVTSGFLEEMQAVLHLHERHAVVAPRTNGQSLLSFPVDGDQPSSQSYRLWELLHGALPRFYIAPVLSNICLLIKSEDAMVFSTLPAFSTRGSIDTPHQPLRIFDTGGKLDVSNVEDEPASLTELAERYTELERKISDFRKFQIDPVETFAILHSGAPPQNSR